jgi:hypothetical protein
VFERKVTGWGKDGERMGRGWGEDGERIMKGWERMELFGPYRKTPYLVSGTIYVFFVFFQRWYPIPTAAKNILENFLDTKMANL